MKHILLILLFLFLTNCGDSAFNDQRETSPAPDGGRARNEPRSPTSEPTSNERRATPPQIPGYVCNSEGICIPESRASKNPKTDAFGFRKGVVAVPYDDEEEEKGRK